MAHGLLEASFLYRAFALWFLTLSSLVFLVVYLDGGLDKQPVVFFIAVGITDMLLIAFQTFYFVKAYEFHQGELFARTEKYMWQRFICHFRGQITKMGVIVCKVAFETILLGRVVFSLPCAAWVMFIPVWLALLLVIIDLSYRLSIIRDKSIAMQQDMARFTD